MSDADGDSQMRSSSSSDADDTEIMFPTANDPPTPQSNPRLVPFPTSELSPPTSQDPPDQNGGGLPPEDLMDLSGGQDLLNRIGMDEDLVARGAGLKDEDMRQAGWAWNNKKARDEYARAMEQVVDKGFNLREFGDPFDESETNGQK
ncbi:MAG: hypothetical protein FRX48_05150 [Lasallia pustulata]|uniref:Uncharacterized protein n=1 Tax=Lasallia pustulata TaxID=136370 RepID=A0A5M8PPJ0_9LECA|nr:MAG: hypothetical protein FRX48_05150 [Lasallia pustulata]